MPPRSTVLLFALPAALRGVLERLAASAPELSYDALLAVIGPRAD